MCVLSGQSIKEALATLEPVVEAAENQKENAVNSVSDSEAPAIRSLVEQLKQDWSQVNRQFDDRFR